MDEDLNQLGALAEYAQKNTLAKLIHWTKVVCDEPVSANSGPLGGPKDPADTVGGARKLGLPAGEWVPVFERAGILTDKLGSAPPRSKATTVGQFLSKMVDRSVYVDAEPGQLTCTLRNHSGRSNRKLFYFQVCEQNPPVGEADVVSGNVDQDLGASGPGDGPEEHLQGIPAPGGNPADHEMNWL